MTEFPCVVGHEIIGVAVRVGSQVKKDIKVDDVVGIGAQVDACLSRDGPCDPCDDQKPNYCPHRVFTYDARHRNGDKTYGGFALYHGSPDHFVVKIPDGLTPGFAAPLMCAGLTVYAPLKQNGAGPGMKVGIVGVGGVGHIAVLFAKAMGADEVVGISRRASKRDDSMSLGADDYIATADDEDWAKKNSKRFDILVLTISSANMPYGDYLGLLKYNGTLVQVGVPEAPVPFFPGDLIFDSRKIVGTLLGTPEEMEEMLQLAADKEIKPWVELRPMSDANQAVLDMNAGKARFRYVLINQ